MELLTVLPAIAAMICLGFLFTRTLHIRDGFGPVLGISAAIVVIELFGTVNLLWQGVIIVLLGSYAMTCIYIFRQKSMQAVRRYLTDYAVVGFIAAAISVQIVYYFSKPAFNMWDEFTHWGRFFKAVYYQHCFGVWISDLDFVHQTYAQGGSALYALLAVASPRYTEAGPIYAMTILTLSCSSAAVAVFLKREQETAISTRIMSYAFSYGFIMLVFTPFIPALTSSYMDIPVGVLFAALLCIMLSQNVEKDIEHFYGKSAAISLVMAAMLTIKDISIAFVLCIMGIWLLYLLIISIRMRTGSWLSHFCLPAIICLIIPMVVFFSWKVMLRLLNRTGDQFDDVGISSFLKRWSEARAGQNPVFYKVWDSYVAAVLHGNSLVYLSSIKVFLILTLVSVVYLVMIRRSTDTSVLKYRLVICMMPIYYFCYLFLLFVVYICGMGEGEAILVKSFDRYMDSFLEAWIIAVICAYMNMLAGRDDEKRTRHVWAAGVCVLVLYFVFSCARHVDLYATPMSVDRAAQHDAFISIKKAQTGSQDHYEQLFAQIEPQKDVDVCIMYSESLRPGFMGQYASVYGSYELYPARVIYVDIDSFDDQDFIDYICNKEIDYLLVDEIPESFADRYATSFVQDISSFEGHEVYTPMVYKCLTDGDDVFFQSVK